jgi:hypothetical protein
MGLREFRDAEGVVWKVWNVTPDSLDKRTMAEDYMRDWQDGWLCFESSQSRRRLAVFPSDWADLGDGELVDLLASAAVVRRREPGETSGEFRQAPDEPPQPPPIDVERPIEGARPSVRRMTPPTGAGTGRSRAVRDSTGRTFVAALYRVAPRAPRVGEPVPTSPGTVLRFVSGSVVLDVHDWPDDWEGLTDAQMVELLGRAQPPHDTSAITDSLPQRRRTDLP